MTAAWTDHLIVAPVLVPLAGAALMLVLDRGHLAVKSAISLLVVLSVLFVSILLLRGASSAGFDGEPAIAVYRLGSWPAPFGIVLVLDWLSAMMLVLSNLLGLTSLVYALARWDRAGPRFHSLILLQLAGLNGAFLTGDLFNLFVFFEVLLAASYGLLLHG
jgi:multicomponent K+:H+ antiporter subunit D